MWAPKEVGLLTITLPPPRCLLPTEGSGDEAQLTWPPEPQARAHSKAPESGPHPDPAPGGPQARDLESHGSRHRYTPRAWQRAQVSVCRMNNRVNVGHRLPGALTARDLAVTAPRQTWMQLLTIAGPTWHGSPGMPEGPRCCQPTQASPRALLVRACRPEASGEPAGS